jgi:hypothetical protein
MAAYRERNPVGPGEAPKLPPAEVNRIWAQISAVPPLKKGLSTRIWRVLSDGIEWLREILTVAPLTTYAATMALMLILIIVPMQLVRMPLGQPPTSDVKGPAVEEPGNLQLAIVGTNGVLERPERPLRETDTLAFRISVDQSGYYSLYMVHAAGTDVIIIDRLLPSGTHDLREAYALGGNRGSNRLVLVYSDQAAPPGREPQLALIHQAAMSEVSALTISDRTLTLHPQLIEVKPQ